MNLERINVFYSMLGSSLQESEHILKLIKILCSVGSRRSGRRLYVTITLTQLTAAKPGVLAGALFDWTGELCSLKYMVCQCQTDTKGYKHTLFCIIPCIMYSHHSHNPKFLVQMFCRYFRGIMFSLVHLIDIFRDKKQQKVFSYIFLSISCSKFWELSG